MAFALRDESSLKRRALGASLVLLLHGLLLLALLHALTTPARRTPQSAREIIFHLIARPAQPKAQTAAPLAESTPRAPRRVAPVVAAQPSAPAPDIQGIGKSLFGCALENLSNLTPQQRAACSTGALARPDGTAVNEPSSHVKDPRRRAAEMAAKTAPAKVPCSYMTNAQTPIGNVPVTMMDLECLADGIFGKGLKPLNGLDH